MADAYLDLTLGQFLELTAAEREAPGAGSVAAMAVALAAALVVKVARCSRDSWPDASGISAQALELQDRCPPLAEEDADAWEEALAALRAAGAAGGRDAELQGKLTRAAELPLAVAETGADVAVLAALAAKLGDGGFRGEAAAAAVLAHAGTRAAVHLVRMNLATRVGDARSGRAALAEQRAADAATDALRAEP
jgi:formiminotetrahydrofolate cyclodeaminase